MADDSVPGGKGHANGTHVNGTPVNGTAVNGASPHPHGTAHGAPATRAAYRPGATSIDRVSIPSPHALTPRGVLALEPAPGAPLSAVGALAGKGILITGTTGFLAKVMLSMLVERFSPERIFVLIRPQKSKSARERFFDEVLGSEMMEPLKQRLGAALRPYVDARVEVLGGDISQPGLGLDAETTARVQPQIDVIINSAGLVNFNPPLDDALEVNTIGVREVASFALGCRGARVVHVSTCFVAGNRSGWIRETDPIVGYFPKKDELDDATFDWRREVKDLEREIAATKASVDDAALEAQFRQEALERLREEGRQPQDRTVRAAMTNARRRWVAEELITKGKRRAAHWGWPNIYTYTKAMGEQVLASTPGLEWSIVRPAIVESSLAYPFPGWNEGMNTSAPIVYLGLKGHTTFPCADDLILDVIPVDTVASVTLAATAALLAGESGKVYQAAVGDVNPCTVDRTVTLLGLYRRRKTEREVDEGKLPSWRAALKKRHVATPSTVDTYRRVSAPAAKSLAGRARRFLDGLEPERMGPLGALVSSARKTVREIESDLGKVDDVFDLFRPFIVENRYVFRTSETRTLFARLDAADRALLPFDPEAIDWRHYWLDVHIPGLEEWVLPKLEEETNKRVTIPRAHRDLAELFDVVTEDNARRVAFRLLRKDHGAETFTYRDVRRAAERVADRLLALGVGKGARVVLGGDNGPEWGVTYFGVLLAGATVVPVDVELSAAEVLNIARAASAKLVVAGGKLLQALDAERAAPSVSPVLPIESFFTELDARHTLAPHAGEALVEVLPARPKRSGDDTASIIFTSGTTGTPKGVVLSDRNFTALTARLMALFELQKTDATLSVLPLHHTFEFSAGFLMPFASGSSITYLEERTPELISKAFEQVQVTAMIGVPAVWESLHRRIRREVGELGTVGEWAVDRLADLNRWLRGVTPWNVGRWVFRPVHDAFGGNLRLLVSGGAALSPRIAKDLRGLGFNLYEGYGLTEAAPVLTVGWPGRETPIGSVGRAIPGVEVRIHDPDGAGIGEVVARGPTIMSGYLDDVASTRHALRDGWLHTGDLGRLDDDKNLFIVGRSKDVIIEASGKNVYPDELEELYGKHALIKELSVVGIPSDAGHGELVACLVVPDYEHADVDRDGLLPEQVRERIREHFREVGAKQPFARRVKTLHFWDRALPRTSTRKIKRPFVKEQLVRLDRALKAGRTEVGEIRDEATRKATWVRRTIASITQRSPDDVRLDARLVDELGFDSMMQLELLSALEAEFPNARVASEELAAVGTVDDVVRLAARDASPETSREEDVGHREEAPPLHLPTPVRALGKAFLGSAQRLAYERLLDVDVEGRGNLPANTRFIVAANHASHLDMGLVKHALGELGDGLVSLAAKDYFFDDPVRRTYFENFTNLLPIDRHGSLKRSLRLASESLRGGSSLLIFPEGTRSRDGELAPFKAAVGYLALSERVDVVPMWLGGTHAAMPVGAALPKERKLSVRIGPTLTIDEMVAMTRGRSRSAAYRLIALELERRVRRLGDLPPPSDDAPPPAEADDASDEPATLGSRA